MDICAEFATTWLVCDQRCVEQFQLLLAKSVETVWTKFVDSAQLMFVECFDTCNYFIEHYASVAFQFS